MNRQRPGLRRVLVSATLLVLAVFAVIVIPEARPLATVVSFLALAALATGLTQVLDLGEVARVRVAGAGLLLLGLGFAAGAVVIAFDPSALPESGFPQISATAQITVGIAGALLFGGLGLAVLLRRAGSSGGVS
ncbi:hypothetical protein [Ornithinimicrobium pratense]|uniref:Uncharacterized protein n=1 Tax=Ornithinimicrobium pratense TaxID=2593973 RepID=A0A5J6V326_9MICO|nr:hypothetical protein [Ornithinimicrobium pratense]QFG67572.1 hypothetical protein FY030_01465 [Ornithinimicrobium pratense]